MIAIAPNPEDPRALAKRRLRTVAAAKRVRTAAEPESKNPAFQIGEMVTRHPVATGAGLLAAAMVIGPVRVIRLGFATARAAMFVGGLLRMAAGARRGGR